MSNIEKLLNALIEGEDVTNFVPRSRVEEFLKACCCGDACGITPRSRIEVLLQALQTKIAEGGGGTGGGGGSAVIEPLTITKNGTYEAGEIGGFGLGKELTFRSDITTAEITELAVKSGSAYPEFFQGDNIAFVGSELINSIDESVYVIQVHTGDDSYDYYTNESYSAAQENGWDLPNTVGWCVWQGAVCVNCEAPTITIPKDSELLSDCTWEDIATLFVIPPTRIVDGFAPITVDVKSKDLVKYLNKTLTEANLTGVESVPENAFYEFWSLKSVVLDGVWEIGNHAFEFCRDLEIYEFPESLEFIGDEAFNCVKAIYATEIPASVMSIGEDFAGQPQYSSPSTHPRPTTLTFKGKPDFIHENAFGTMVGGDRLEGSLRVINVPWAEGEVANAPWCTTKPELLTINYNYTGE